MKPFTTLRRHLAGFRQRDGQRGGEEPDAAEGAGDDQEGVPGVQVPAGEQARRQDRGADGEEPGRVRGDRGRQEGGAGQAAAGVQGEGPGAGRNCQVPGGEGPGWQGGGAEEGEGDQQANRYLKLSWCWCLEKHVAFILIHCCLT